VQEAIAVLTAAGYALFALVREELRAVFGKPSAAFEARLPIGITLGAKAAAIAPYPELKRTRPNGHGSRSSA